MRVRYVSQSKVYTIINTSTEVMDGDNLDRDIETSQEDNITDVPISDTGSDSVTRQRNRGCINRIQNTGV